MRATILIVALLVVLPIGYFCFKVVTFDPSASVVVNPPGTVAQAPVFDQTVALANDYWSSQGLEPTCNKIRGLVVARIPNWRGIDADGGARAGRCEILMKRSWYRAAVSSPQRFCALVVHEVGHIYGLDHSSDPNNVMYTPQLFVPRACRVLQ